MAELGVQSVRMVATSATRDASNREDFVEGVRAVLVDKDNAPRWDPATPEGVTDHMIDRIFAPLDAESEWSPEG